jgi:chromosome segregation ATPase
MGCMKGLVRVGVIGVVLGGAVLVVANTPRGRAVFHQVRGNINAKIDANITDPVALRVQLRDLAEQYPKRIADVRGDLAELREQIAQLNRESEVADRVVGLADGDLDKLQSALAQAEDASIQQVSMGEARQILIVFKADKLDMESAYNKVTEITNTRNAYSARSEDIERDLGYLGQQEDRLTTLLNKLETERQTFQTQLWELDRKVDAVARNDRMIEIMQKRQKSIDEQSRYRAASLDQITSHLADIKAKQEAKLAGLVADQSRENYEDSAKAQIDRELSAKQRAEAGLKQIRTTKVKVKPIEIHAAPGASKCEDKKGDEKKADVSSEPLVIKDTK